MQLPHLIKAVIYRRYPRGINRLYYGFHYVWHRVFPKIKGLKNIYFAVTKGRNRTFHRVEILGRLYHAGFEVVYESTTHGEFRVIARKVKDPISEGTPSSSPIAKLERVGKNGKIITVYKFRTMYSYSEYLQEYVYEHRRLDKTGKFYHDYRVNTMGALLRKTWLDELPMVVNMMKGEMKLVGAQKPNPVCSLRFIMRRCSPTHWKASRSRNAAIWKHTSNTLYAPTGNTSGAYWATFF